MPGHSLGVCKTALRLARELGVPAQELPVVALGALMHDIGKVFVGGRLLSKTAPLTEAEREMIRLHPLLGEALLAPNLADETVLGIVRWHHERWDGGGYPDGLGGDEIPLAARIVAIADAFTAMCERRPYRPARRREEALEELRRLASSQFDAGCVDTLLRSLARDGDHPTEVASVG